MSLIDNNNTNNNTNNTNNNNVYPNSQNELLLTNLLEFYKENNNLQNMLNIINGKSNISLRIVDWFVTNYAKSKFTTYSLPNKLNKDSRFNVYNNYKLQLKAYSKKRFDPFCRWDRITIPYFNNSSNEDIYIETTIGQLNFFKWAIENNVIDYIINNYIEIEKDMNSRNSTSKKKELPQSNSKTRKKRQELSISATKTIKKEEVEIIVEFN